MKWNSMSPDFFWVGRKVKSLLWLETEKIGGNRFGCWPHLYEVNSSIDSIISRSKLIDRKAPRLIRHPERKGKILCSVMNDCSITEEETV